MNPHDHIEDAEFDDFLKGEGDLARQLQGMRQPQAPEALSAAILARAAADMDATARAGMSANDAIHGGDPVLPPARHYLRRARIPLGLAASVVLTLFVVRGLMPQAFAPTPQPQEALRVAAAPEAKMAQAPALKEEAMATPKEDLTVAATTELAAPPPVAKTAPVRRSAPAHRPVPAPEADIAALQAAPFAAQASKPEALGYAAAPPMVAMRSAPAPAAAFMRSAPAPVTEALPAPEWLTRIAGMLQAGQTQEAHAEWLKFRMRYPEAELPPELRRQLEAIN